MRLKRVKFYRVPEGVNVEPDMLRYDVAFQSNRHPGIVALPVFHTKTGNLGGQVTTGRWASFRCPLSELPEAEQSNLLDSLQSSDWVTYRHPKKKGMVDYGELVPIPLSKYLQVKDSYSVDE